MLKYRKILMVLLFSMFSNVALGDSSADENLQENLLQAYPTHIKSIDKNNVIWQDGYSMLFDDNIDSKTNEQKLNNPSLKDQLDVVYEVRSNPQVSYNPGRVRYNEFFTKMYGSSQDEVKDNLVEFIWMPETYNTRIKATKINGIAGKLEAIGKEFDSFPDDVKEFLYIADPSDVFIWRRIAGTDRMSIHSFAAAFDINYKRANYWRWDQDKGLDYHEYRNDVPLEIVKVFEKYGFIWGGAWHKYDTMHFEYRPELLVDKKKRKKM
jgi:peptidoglycan LD-endopeptidase CwlK